MNPAPTADQQAAHLASLAARLAAQPTHTSTEALIADTLTEWAQGQADTQRTYTFISRMSAA